MAAAIIIATTSLGTISVAQVSAAVTIAVTIAVVLAILLVIIAATKVVY